MVSPLRRAAYGLRTRAAIRFQDVSQAGSLWSAVSYQGRRISREKTSMGEVGMVKKICGAIAFGVTVMLVLTFGELPSASAIHEQDQRTDRRAAQHRVKKR